MPFIPLRLVRYAAGATPPSLPSSESPPSKGPEPNPHPERPFQPTPSPPSAPSLRVPTDLTSDDNEVLDIFFSITDPRIRQPHTDEEVAIPTEGACIKDDLEGATELSTVERTVTLDATKRPSKGKSLPAGHLSGNTLPDATVAEDVARESDCSEEAVVEDVIAPVCKRVTTTEEELAVPTYGPVTQEGAGSHSMEEGLVTTRGAFGFTSPSSSKSQVVADPSSSTNPLPTPLFTVKPTHLPAHRVEGDQPEQRLETLLPSSQTSPPKDTALVSLPLAHEIPDFDASLSAASVYKLTTNSDRRLAPSVIPENLPKPEAECATSQPVASDSQLSDPVLPKVSELYARVNHLYEFTRQLATASRPVFEAVSSHEMTLKHVQSSLSKIREDMDVRFNSTLPGRARTPPDLIRRPHDLHSRFPSFNDHVFDGALPADDLGVYIVKPCNRSVELRPAGSYSGLKAAHGTASGSSTKGIDHPTTVQRKAEAVLPQEDEEEVPVGLTRLPSPPLSRSASLLATRTARAAANVRREPESGRINKAPDFVSAANFSNAETSSRSKRSYATKGLLALRVADTSNQPTASVAEDPLESETDQLDLELSDVADLMAFGQSLPVQSPNLLLTSNLAEPAHPNLSLAFKPTSCAPLVRSNPRKVRMTPQRPSTTLARASTSHPSVPRTETQSFHRRASYGPNSHASTSQAPRKSDHVKGSRKRCRAPSPDTNSSSRIEFMGETKPANTMTAEPPGSSFAEHSKRHKLMPQPRKYRFRSTRSSSSAGPSSSTQLASSAKLLSPNKQSSYTKPSLSPIPSSAKSSTVSTKGRNGGISGALSVTSSSKFQSEPPSGLQQSSPAAATTAKSSLLKMSPNPYDVAVREEPPRKRRRTERGHGIPGRLERLLAMSNGRRIIKESAWPKFPKGWNTWRMLKQEVQCDGCNGRLHYPCAGLTLDVLFVEAPFHCPDCQYLIAADREDEILPGPADRCVRHDCCRRRKQKMEVGEMDDEEYFIKRVIGRRAIGRLDPDDRNSGRVFEYLVEWEGYDMEDSSWEPAGHIHHDKDGNRPYVDSFLSEAKRAEVKLRLRVAMLPESQILAVWDPISGEKRNKKGKAKATNRESGEEDDSYSVFTKL
ncbi:hypothetical protein CspHIS471_0401230 [Cutaneotrichosporon sp. HIS471]|nr:hypothetical protein CspHIS471_0401230 [Cutaneotrichosporon sp. HIS471]